MKADLMNRARVERAEFALNNKNVGDEIDQSVAFLTEHNFLVSQDRIRTQLMEINFALARMDAGTFGICDETGEIIEAQRLLALPYTRLSVEGAELREALNKKYVPR